MSLLFHNCCLSHKLRLVLVGCCALLPVHGFSAEWSIKGDLAQSLGYDDNVRMSNLPQGSFEYKIIPTLTFLHKTDVSEINADASYGTQVYTDIPGLDQDVQKYGLGGLYKMERFDWRLNLNYSVTPTRNTALLDSGDFSTAANNTTWSILPSMSYKLTELDSLILSPAYSETTFSNPGNNPNNTFFRNNNTKSIHVAWQHIWSEKFNSTPSFFYSHFESQQGIDPTRTFDSYGLNLGNSYIWSENWRFQGTFGVRYTESESAFNKSSSFGFLADTGVEYTGESFNTGINFSRSLMPSNFGQLQEITAVGWHINYKIYERLTTSFVTSYQDSTRVADTTGINLTRENIVVQPAVHWELTPEWKLTGSYRYRTLDSITRSADSNMFMLSVNYNWPGIKMSK